MKLKVKIAMFAGSVAISLSSFASYQAICPSEQMVNDNRDGFYEKIYIKNVPVIGTMVLNDPNLQAVAWAQVQISGGALSCFYYTNERRSLIVSAQQGIWKPDAQSGFWLSLGSKHGCGEPYNTPRDEVPTREECNFLL